MSHEVPVPGDAASHGRAGAPPLLELDGYGVAFGDHVVLRGIDLRIGAGDDDRVVALLGASMSGRTTLLRSLAGLNRADPDFREWGQARLLGQPLSEDHRPRLAPPVAGEATATLREALLGPLRRLAERGAPQPTAVPWDEIACDALADHGLVALVERLDEPLRAFAPAQRRALAVLSHALLGPPLLMIDEPAGGLDDAAATWLVDWIARLGRRQPLIVAIDRIDLAQRLGGRRLRLEGGRLAPSLDAPGAGFVVDDRAEAAFVRTMTAPSLGVYGDEPPTAFDAGHDAGIDVGLDPGDTLADAQPDAGPAPAPADGAVDGGFAPTQAIGLPPPRG